MRKHSEFSKEAGIYKLTCVENEKVYIGKAVNLNKRLNQHKNSKVGYYLKNAITKYGWEAFTVEILETFDNFNKLKDNKYLLDREAHYIKLFESTDRTKGYNICKYSSDTTGMEKSEETKAKMSKAKLGVPLSEEHKEKLRKPKSKETRDRMSKSQKGRLRSEETKDKMRQSQLGNTNNLGNPHSDESKEKMRQARIDYWKIKKQQK